MLLPFPVKISHNLEDLSWDILNGVFEVKMYDSIFLQHQLFLSLNLLNIR